MCVCVCARARVGSNMRFGIVGSEMGVLGVRFRSSEFKMRGSEGRGKGGRETHAAYDEQESYEK